MKTDNTSCKVMKYMMPLMTVLLMAMILLSSSMSAYAGSSVCKTTVNRSGKDMLQNIVYSPQSIIADKHAYCDSQLIYMDPEIPDTSETSETPEYSDKGLNRGINWMESVAVTFFLMVICSVLIMEKMYEQKRELLFQKTMNDLLLQESRGEQFIYDVRSMTVSGSGSLITKHINNKSRDFFDVKKSIAGSYPDIAEKMEEISDAIDEVVATGKKKRLEQPLYYNGQMIWVETVLVPYMKNGKTISHVFGESSDITYLHNEFEQNVQMHNKAPGGFHRCWLGGQIRLEYVSDGLCRLLGYSRKELEDNIQDVYETLIVEDDRHLYLNHLRKLSETECTSVCEYRMIHKDGHLITVSDSMESVRSSNGIMYGYSAVTDITQKAAELEAIREKIEEKELRESFLLNEQLLLVAAAKTAYQTIFSINLTQNTYNMMESRCDFLNDIAGNANSLNNLLSAVSDGIPDVKEKSRFVELFNPSSLLSAYKRGQNIVSYRYRILKGLNNNAHWIDTMVVFVEPNAQNDIRAIVLVSDADSNQKMVDDLHDMLRRESVLREAIMTSSTYYMEINLMTGLIEGSIFDYSDRTNPRTVSIPELIETVSADDDVKWWEEHIVISDVDELFNMIDPDFLLSSFRKGHYYIEVPFKIRLLNDMVLDWAIVFVLFRETNTGYIKAICILRDSTDQEAARKEITQLTQDLREARVKNSVSQMQPHFLYNALASIREIIMEDPQYASDLICDFTTHLRACVKSLSSNDLIPFSQEMENIEAYINIEKMRFGDRLKVNYDIRSANFLIAPLSIQPLVENAVRHGIYERGEKGGTLTVSTKEENGMYIVTVKDDGVGFDYEKIKDEIARGEKDSTGLDNLTFRLEKLLNAVVDINSEIGKGTEVTVRIPENHMVRR